MEDKRFSKCLNVISIELLSLISGGGGDSDKTPRTPNSDKQPTVKVAGGGNSDIAYGTITVTKPVTPNTDVGVGVGGNTYKGITDGRVTITYNF